MWIEICRQSPEGAYLELLNLDKVRAVYLLPPGHTGPGGRIVPVPILEIDSEESHSNRRYACEKMMDEDVLNVGWIAEDPRSLHDRISAAIQKCGE